MIIAYILCKDRSLRIRFIRRSNDGVFEYNGLEYTIDPSKIYSKKLFFIKTFFWIMYMEGNPNPIEFKDDNISITNDVSLNEISIILKKIRNAKKEMILLILIALNTLMLFYLVYGISEIL